MTAPDSLTAWLDDETQCGWCGHEKGWHAPDWILSDLGCMVGSDGLDGCPCGGFEDPS